MTRYDLFLKSFKKDYKAKGLTQFDVADQIGLSPRQFARHIRGETKEAYMPIQTIADLRRLEIISEETINAYWQGLREMLRFKTTRNKEETA